MPRKTFRFIAKILLSILLLAVIITSGLLLWVATGPREVAIITPYLEEELSPQDQSFQVVIGSTELHWDGWSNPIGLHAKNVGIIFPGTNTRADLPEVVLRIDFAGTLLGELGIRAIAINNPGISLHLTESGQVSFGIDRKETSAPSNVTISVNDIISAIQKGSLGDLTRIEITNARMAVHNHKNDEILASPGSNVVMVKSARGMMAELSTGLLQDAGNAKFKLRAVADFESGNIGVRLGFDNAYPTIFAQFIPNNSFPATIDIPLSGTANMIISGSGDIVGGDFEITGSNGYFSYLEHFREKIPVRSAFVSGSFEGEAASITIDESTLEIGETIAIGLNGQFFRENSEEFIKLNAQASGVKASDLDKYWPLTLAPLTRTWVTENVSKGQIEGKVALDIKPEMKGLSMLPGEAVKATVSVKGGMVRYLPEHPLVKNVDAVIDFTGDSMQMEATQAHFMKNTVSKRLSLNIPDFNAAVLMLHTNFDVNTTAVDIAQFLSRPEFTFARQLNLQPDAISGSANGSISLDVLLYETLEDGTEKEGDLKNFTIDAKLQGFSQDKFFKKYDINATSGALRADNTSLTFTGTAKLRDTLVTLDIKSDFNKAVDVINAEFSNISISQLRSLGYAMPPQIGGDIGLKAQITSYPNRTEISADADITPAVLAVREVGLLKPTGTSGKLTLSAVENRKTRHTKVDSFELKSQDIYAKGIAFLDAEGALQRLDLQHLVSGRNNLSAVYEQKGEVLHITARGRSVDLSNLSSTEEKESFSQTMFDNQQIDMRFAEVILGEKRSVYAVNANWNCDHIRCYSAYVSSAMRGRKPVNFKIYADGSKRKVKLESADAGEFLRTLDIIDNLRNGKLVVEAAFNDTLEGNPLSGRVTIRDYSLKQAPVLAKILTIASLTGILDALMGNGITFSEMEIPFVLINDVATIKDAKSRGASIGITASGTLNLKTAEVDMKGVVVPAYMFNSMLGSIPIIGELAGGDEGLFAANYSVKGEYPDNTSVSVNPLSILTPGFLRGIFDASEEQGKTPGNKANGKKKDSAR